MIIDMHCHPTFLDPRNGTAPPSAPPPGFPKNKKLDVVADPSKMRMAMHLTSKQYKSQKSKMFSVEEFQRHSEETHDLVNFLCPVVKGQPVREMNERNAALIKRFGHRAIGFAGFDPTGKDPVGDIEHAINDLGFKGLKLIASLIGRDINDEIFYPCYEKAQELGVPITLHTGAGLIMGCRIKHVRPILVDDVAFDFPGLKIICAHLGCWDYMDVHSLLVRHPHVYSDLSAWPLDERYVDLVPWKLFERTVPHKLLLGSDYPAAQTPREALESVRNLPIGEDFKAKILGDNAAGILGLK